VESGWETGDGFVGDFDERVRAGWGRGEGSSLRL
jgi:hypothetical protein